MIFEKLKINKCFLLLFIFPFILFYPNPFDESQESVIIFGTNNLSIKLFDLRTEPKLVSFKANNSFNLSLNCSFVKRLNQFVLKMLNFSNYEFFSFENQNFSEDFCDLAIERKYGSLVNTNAKYMIEYNHNNQLCNVSIAYSSIKDGCFYVYLCNSSFWNYCGENDDVITPFFNYLYNLTIVQDVDQNVNDTQIINQSNLSIENIDLNCSNNSYNYSEMVVLENMSFENATKINIFENNVSTTTILSNNENQTNFNINKTNSSVENQLFEIQIDDVFYEDESISYTIINKGCKGVFEKKVYGLDSLGKQVVKIFSNSTIVTRRTFKFTMPAGNYVLNIRCDNVEINSSFDVILKQNSCEDIFKRISFLKTQISFLKENDCTFQFSCYYPNVFDRELNIRNKKSFKYSELNCSFFKISFGDLFYYYAVNDFINEFTTKTISNKREKNKNVYYVLIKEDEDSNLTSHLKISTKLLIQDLLIPFLYNDSIITNSLDIEIQPRLLGCEVSLNYYDFSNENFQKEKKSKKSKVQEEDKNTKENQLIYYLDFDEFRNNLTRKINLTQIKYLENVVTLYFDKKENIVLKKNVSLVNDFELFLFLNKSLNNSNFKNNSAASFFLNVSFKGVSENSENSSYFSEPKVIENLSNVIEEEFNEELILEQEFSSIISENSSQNVITLSNNSESLKNFQSRKGFKEFIKNFFEKVSGFFVKFFKSK